MADNRYGRWSADGPTPGSDEWRRIQAGINDVMNHITRSPGIPQRVALPPAKDEKPRSPGTGSVDLKPVPGIPAMDRIAESFAQQDRLEALVKQRALARELAGDATSKEPEADPKATKK